ncbi:hypothetical protein NL533_36310, partial [Klebsiella pneumoniae]|nr:hypothetical protein [Klebsiella pneumoniae]
MRPELVLRSIRTLWFVTSIFAIVVIPCEAYAEATTTIRWTFRKGAQFQFVVDINRSCNIVSLDGQG